MKTAMIINSEFFGRGSEALGTTLMNSFLRKLRVQDVKPDIMLFYNSGVKLLAEESEVLDSLDALSDDGVDLVACGTCVKYFELEDKMKAGRVGTMDEIATAMLTCEKAITL